MLENSKRAAVTRRTPDDVRRIVVFRALYLGDFLCAVPTLRALKRRYPLAELTFIGLPWTREIVDRFASIDRFLEFPGYRGLEGLISDSATSRRFIQEARSYRYDLAIQMHGDGRLSNGFVARLGARVSLGYRLPGCNRPHLLDLELEMESGEHEVLRWLRLVDALGAGGSPDLEFPLAPVDWMEAEAVARSIGIDLKRPLLAVHPGAKEPARRWPAAAFSEAADRLAEQLGAQVIVTGARDEVAIGREVAVGMRNHARILAGCTSIGCLAALLSLANLLITNDTGPSHLAAALGVPSVVLFGPTEPERWAPLDITRHKALWSGRGNPITSIPVAKVVEESLGLVKECAYLTS